GSSSTCHWGLGLLNDLYPEEAVMARLVVEALGAGGDNRSSGVARPGNRDPLPLLVSVTRYSGLPVTGLSAANFQADCPIVAAGGGGVTVDRVDEPHAGVYRV